MRAREPEDRWLVDERVRGDLASLDATLAEITACDDAGLERIARHLVGRRGKRIRPALLFLAARLGSPQADPVRRAGAAVELLHVAALYHDDLMDQASTRRGLPSANAQWGDRPAAVAGTFLLARATRTLATLGDHVVSLASQATLTACSGQLREADNAYRLDQEISSYLQVIAGKTATFFELPCMIGAAVGGLPHAYAQALREYGSRIGIAFQLIDDALDLSGNPSEMGKAVGQDLRQGTYALPTLLALGSDAPRRGRLRELLAKFELTDEDVAETRAIVAETGAVVYTRNLANEYAHHAGEAVRGLPSGDVKDSLLRLARQTVLRRA